jgi:hypothetical protein
MMTRLVGLGFIAGAMLAVAPLQAQGAACCAKSTQQKAKLTALQEKCMKDGCTGASRAKFLKSAQRILSADQYAQLKAECEKAEKKQS